MEGSEESRRGKEEREHEGRKREGTLEKKSCFSSGD
jgi:hypothetical protein